MRDGLADHWAEMVGPKAGQVNEGDEVLGSEKLVDVSDYAH